MRRVRNALGIAAIVVVVLGGSFIGYMATSNQPPRLNSLGWVHARNMPDARGELAAALVLQRPGGPSLCAAAACSQGLVYVAGGFEGSLGAVSRRVDVYDPQTNMWKRGPDLPEPRHHAAAAAIEDTLYVTGGVRSSTGFKPEANFWALRPGRLSFERLADMPEPRSGQCAVTVNGKLYVLAGDGPSSKVMIYQPGSGWKLGAAMPDPRNHAAGVAVGSKIFVLGGRNSRGVTNRVDIYDVATDSWAAGPPMPVKDSGMAAGFLGDGNLHVVGGEDPRYIGGGVRDRHYILLGATWMLGSKPILAVHGTPGVVVQGKLLIVGGSRRQGVYSVFGWTGLSQVFDPGAYGAVPTPVQTPTKQAGKKAKPQR